MMNALLLFVATLRIYFINGAMRSECSITQLNKGEDNTIRLMDSASSEVMWVCISDEGCVFTTDISLKSGSLSPLTPAFLLSDTGRWYTLTVEQVDLFVPEAAFLLVNGGKIFLGDYKIDYINVTGDCAVAWANCQLHGKCPFMSSTRAPTRSSLCSTSVSPSPVPYPKSDSGEAVPTLAILLVMAVLIILLLSINNCRLMMLLRNKESLNVLSFGPESRLGCQEHCKLLERHHHHGVLQFAEKEKIPSKHSFQAVNTQITLVQSASTEDLNSVIEVNARRVPEENEILPLQTSQELINRTTVLCHSTRHERRNSLYGSTDTQWHHIV